MASPFPVAGAEVFGNFAGLQSLKQAAGKDDPAAIRQVARQFESLFARMLLKSMRQAIGSDPIFGGDQMQAYQQMYDDQLSIELTKGHGLGLADMLVRQLQRGHAGAQRSGQSDAQAGTAEPESISGTDRKQARGSAGAGFPITAEDRAAVGAAGQDSSGAPVQAGYAIDPEQRRFAIDRSQSRGFSLERTGRKFPLASPVSGAPSGSAAPAPAAESAPVSPAQRQRFVQAMLPQARRAAQALGVAPQSVLAQAALETHWGQSIPQDGSGRSTNNLFGMKAGSGWDGPTAAAGTLEFEGGTAHTSTAKFRAYASPTQCFDDYVQLIEGDPRYSGALGTGANVQAFAGALQRGGYATDPDYARKLCAVAGDISGMLKSTGTAPITGGADPHP